MKAGEGNLFWQICTAVEMRRDENKWNLASSKVIWMRIMNFPFDRKVNKPE